MSGLIDKDPGTQLRRFRAHSSYKPSGIEWLGEIPAHWEVRRLKYLASLNSESLGDDTSPDREMVYVDIGGVDSLGRIVERESLAFAAAPSRARRLVKGGDVIVSTVRTYLRAIAQIVDPDPNLVVSTGFAVVRPRGMLCGDFAAYALRAPYFVERVVANSTGVSFPAINESEMSTYALAVPPRPEQRTIAAFLARETAKIDALVAKKERLIELLQEERAARITRAVTKGLDPKVPMKDSGVEWLGEIPAHWDLLRADAFLRYEKVQIEPSKIADDLVFHYSIPAVQETGDGRLEAPSEIDSAKLEILGERLLVSKLNPRKGVVILASKKDMATVCSSEFVPFVVRGSDLRWALYLFLAESTRQRLSAVVRSATRSHQRAEVDEIVKIWHGVPRVSEQRKIAEFLDSQTARIDKLINKVRSAIERLQQLRSALISAAVTGKIDVREEAA